VRLGLIGAGDRGQFVTSVFQKNVTVELAAVCDVYTSKIDQVQSKTPSAKSFTDHRKLLEMKDLDVALVAYAGSLARRRRDRRAQRREGSCISRSHSR
jgi:predicted dehydrogenase